jgi:hypothetical protein
VLKVARVHAPDCGPASGGVKVFSAGRA